VKPFKALASLSLISNTLAFWIFAVCGARVSTNLRLHFAPRVIVGILLFAAATVCLLNLRRELKRFES
jgi:Mn2+/Fe2+ NRAMP family transporter